MPHLLLSEDIELSVSKLSSGLENKLMQFDTKSEAP